MPVEPRLEPVDRVRRPIGRKDVNASSGNSRSISMMRLKPTIMATVAAVLAFWSAM